MKYIASAILIVLGFITIPLGKLFGMTQKWYLPMYKKDKVIYFAFAPFYWILFLLTFSLSWIRGKVAKLTH